MEQRESRLWHSSQVHTGGAWHNNDGRDVNAQSWDDFGYDDDGQSDDESMSDWSDSDDQWSESESDEDST